MVGKRNLRFQSPSKTMINSVCRGMHLLVFFFFFGCVCIE